MIKSFPIFVLLLNHFWCVAQCNEDPHFILRTFYDGDLRQQAMDYIAENNFGFYNYRIGSGAGTPRTVLDSIKHHNQQTDSILTTEFGAGWEVNYQNLADSLTAEFNLANSIILSDSITNQKIKSEYWFDIYVRPLGLKGWYEFLYYDDDELLSHPYT